MNAYIKITSSEVQQIVADYIAKNHEMEVDPKTIDVHMLGEMGDFEIPICMEKQSNRSRVL